MIVGRGRPGDGSALRFVGGGRALLRGTWATINPVPHPRSDGHRNLAAYSTKLHGFMRPDQQSTPRKIQGTSFHTCACAFPYAAARFNGLIVASPSSIAASVDGLVYHAKFANTGGTMVSSRSDGGGAVHGFGRGPTPAGPGARPDWPAPATPGGRAARGRVPAGSRAPRARPRSMTQAAYSRKVARDVRRANPTAR